MRISRRDLLVTLAAPTVLGACGGGSDAEAGHGGHGGLGTTDTATITGFTPTSVPASATQPITVLVDFSVDLQTTTAGVVRAGYQLAVGQIVQSAAAQAVGPGTTTGALGFPLPASALSSNALAVVITLGDADTMAVLAQDIQAFTRT